jgi:aminopeptidase N
MDERDGLPRHNGDAHGQRHTLSHPEALFSNRRSSTFSCPPVHLLCGQTHPPLKLKEEKAWQVPLSVTGDGTNTVFRKVLSTFEDTLRLPEDLAKSTWLKLNVGFNGFYRVKYSDELFSALSDALITQVLPTVDRLGIANDAFALSRAGYIRTDKVLSLIEYFKEEKVKEADPYSFRPTASTFIRSTLYG